MDPSRSPEVEMAALRARNRTQLEGLIAAEVSQPVNSDVECLARALGARPGAEAIVFYGSGLWGKAGADTLYDFYVLVSRFRDWSPGLMAACFGSLVPPNVYYFEMRIGDRTVRCKYAVMRRSQFEAAALGRHHTPQIWARFCQPARLLEVKSDDVRQRLIRAIADAVVVFHERTLPLAAGVPVAEFWQTGLRFTYASEIRSERASRPARLVDAAGAAFVERSRLALPLCRQRAWIGPDEAVHALISSGERLFARVWLTATRPWQKCVALTRLIKAGFTFQGGLDYLRWKVETHSGVVVPITDFQRRHPVISGLLLLWKVRRRGGVR